MSERTAYDSIHMGVFNVGRSSMGSDTITNWVGGQSLPVSGYVEGYAENANCLKKPWSYERTAYDKEMMKQHNSH